MQFRLYGKIISRSVRHVATKTPAYDLYQVAIEEPGLYPSHFQVSTKDPSLFGPSDGPFAVGNFCTVTGFINGSRREVQRKDGSGKFMSYSTYLTAKSVETAAETAAPAPDNSQVNDDSDIPF